MITLEIDLAQLKHALMKTPKGADCIVLPIAENKFELFEKKIKLKVVGFDYVDKRPNIKYPDTHLLKQSFSKEELAAMEPAQKDALPILGNARIGSGTGHAEQPPQDLNSGKVADGLDNLPF